MEISWLLFENMDVFQLWAVFHSKLYYLPVLFFTLVNLTKYVLKLSLDIL